MGSGNDQHRYQACRDRGCERYACRVWKEAFREGYDDGHDDGYRAGHEDGYREGYDDGIRACPRSHSG